jgi:hypothetical protein
VGKFTDWIFGVFLLIQCFYRKFWQFQQEVQAETRLKTGFLNIFENFIKGKDRE